MADSLDALALGKACLSAKWNWKPHNDGRSIMLQYSKDWGPTCGNGIVEPNEECDCGGPLACQNNRCCQADTCKLVAGAACGFGDCCNMTSCTPLASGVLCRLAVDHRCDYPEFCDGVKATCPPDLSVMSDWPCDGKKTQRCRLRACLPPRWGAKFSGPRCELGKTVPTTAGDCKPMHEPGPAEQLEEWVDPLPKDDIVFAFEHNEDSKENNSTLDTDSKLNSTVNHRPVLETQDRGFRHVGSELWLAVASTVVLVSVLLPKPATETPAEMLLSRVRRYDPRMRNHKVDLKYRFQFTRVNVSINQQSRFLTKFGPYIIRLHLYLEKDLESLMKSTKNLIATAKKVVNFANSLLRPFNFYIMVASTHIPSKHVGSSLEPRSNDILYFLNDYNYQYYSYMFEEVINCVFIFLGRDHMNYSISDSSGHPCKKDYGKPKCKGFVMLETNKPNYIVTAGVALAHEISHRVGCGHDNADDKCRCEFSRCLMDQYVGMDDEKSPIGWSTCSIDKLAESLDALALGKACLSANWSSGAREDGQSITVEYSKDWGPTCGNGIVEPGEECDCGGPLACRKDRCCQADACKLVKGAACDFPEFCDGKSSVCPPDVSVLPDWLCDKATGGLCRLGYCLPPRRVAKYSGPNGGWMVPASDGGCKKRHNPGPAEQIEEWTDSLNETVSDSAAKASQKPIVKETDQAAQHLRSGPLVVAASVALGILPYLLEFRYSFESECIL
uniref:Disintegrin domain-containing protein n=1 Tax=Macrostomum lignano TaxID=282301 RepID=A0A1I8FIT5_9PLAT